MNYIRKLEREDASFMLEWMRDVEITDNFKFDFSIMDERKVEEFIDNSFSEANKHFAIVDKKDEYMGTISLKMIDLKNRNAEYAIVMRKKAQGTGLALAATREILQYAFKELHLHRVYLNVLDKNKRANTFYKKCGFRMEGTFHEHVYLKGKFYDLNWYSIVCSELLLHSII